MNILVLALGLFLTVDTIAMSFAVFSYLVIDEYNKSDAEMIIRIIVSILLLPISPIIGPYFVYKLWRRK